MVRFAARAAFQVFIGPHFTWFVGFAFPGRRRFYAAAAPTRPGAVKIQAMRKGDLPQVDGYLRYLAKLSASE